MNRRQFIKGSAVGAGVLIGGAAAYGMQETSRLGVTRAHASEIIQVGLRVVQLSDLHLHSLGAVHEKLADRLDELKPDVVIISGDTLDYKRRVGLLPELLQMLPRAPHMFATLGNWEHKIGISIDALARTYAQHDIELLINRKAHLRGRISDVEIAGIDDSTDGQPDFQVAQRGEHPTICVAHSPAFRDMLLKRVLDETRLPELMLSGHTHGGQITFAGWAPVRPRGSGHYLYGWYRERRPHLFVSRGIGTTSIPIRLGAEPEIVVFDL